MTRLEHMRAMLKKHNEKMDELLKEIEHSSGYRKQDLIRQYREMEKDKAEFMMYARKEIQNARSQ